MNLQKLFQTQAKLDERIVEEHGLQGQDLLDKKILALQVELGELANEWRGFKFWSKDQEPRIKQLSGSDVFVDYTYPIRRNPLLEEYVDCLHFILSIGLEDTGSCAYNWDYSGLKLGDDITFQFINLFFSIEKFYNDEETLETTIEMFIGLGEMLGFTWEQIEQAYLDKNKINHTRQDTGY